MDLSKIGVTLLPERPGHRRQDISIAQSGILHIATHGYWSPAGDNATEGYRIFNAMVNSGLLLTGVVNYYSSPVYPDTYDGILTAYEAQNLDLENTSLVILLPAKQVLVIWMQAKVCMDCNGPSVQPVPAVL